MKRNLLHPLAGITLAAIGLVGCGGSLEEQTKPTGSIIGKTTQDIGKFDPAEGKKVSDGKVEITNPITGPLEAYGPMLEKGVLPQIDYLLELYRAEHDRYPKNYEEFMSEVIKKNDIKLPVLPGGKKYQYDEKNHKLIVVDG